MMQDTLLIKHSGCFDNTSFWYFIIASIKTALLKIRDAKQWKKFIANLGWDFFLRNALLVLIIFIQVLYICCFNYITIIFSWLCENGFNFFLSCLQPISFIKLIFLFTVTYFRLRKPSKKHTYLKIPSTNCKYNETCYF